MEAIKIRVTKELDGFNFSISPPVRELMQSLFPNAQPATNVFVGYDLRRNFESNPRRLEKFIYPALLGVENPAELRQKIAEISFVDTQTGDVLHSLRLAE